MNVLEGYIRRFGLPQSPYADKHSTYKIISQPSEHQHPRGEKASTQFAYSEGFRPGIPTESGHPSERSRPLFRREGGHFWTARR